MVDQLTHVLKLEGLNPGSSATKRETLTCFLASIGTLVVEQLASDPKLEGLNLYAAATWCQCYKTFFLHC